MPGIAGEVEARLREWNATEVSLEPGARIERWVAQQATTRPDSPAVEARGVTLTYRELDARANQFANLLHSRGAGHGSLVGLCMSRSIELVPALLGVLKTGAAYVPLDPGFPRERLHYMAKDAGLKLVVTQAAHADLSGLPRECQIRVDDDAALLSAASILPLPPRHHPADSPAYVIYTSGSTGKPKGVVLSQRSVCNFLASMRREPGLTADDRLLAVTTLSFDIAVLELLLPLVTGARVVVAQREDAMDGRSLSRLIAEKGITLMQATPTTWHLMLDAGWHAPRGFRALCGGEAMPPSLAARLLQQGVDLWNMYGPTETTVWSTLERVGSADKTITVGRPIDNTQVWVLDDQRRPCAVGQEGEICIGGAGVAIGYFKRPELTAERFMPDPFSAEPDARLYRTGDLGKWREDGRIEHLGRLDFQVKIRGYRIELGEIESRLAALPGVARSVVVPKEDAAGDKRLVGYVVMAPGLRFDAAEARKSLRETLPDYMVPQQIAPLPSLPLLPNGKIDRKALSNMEVPAASVQPSLHLVSGTPKPAVTDPVEQRVLAIWQRALETKNIGLDDSFFDVGGHSILALRMLNQIEKEFGKILRLATMFEAPTIRALARLLKEDDADRAETCVVTVHDKGSKAPLFFVSGWGGAIIVFNALSRALGPEQPLYVLDTALFDNERRSAETVEVVASQMIEDMRRVQPEGPYHLCGFSLGGKYVYEIAQQLTRAGDEVALLALMDCPAPGYPRTRSRAARLALHAKYLVTHGLRDNYEYLASRMRWLRWRMTEREGDFFAGDTEMAKAQFALALQAAADATSEAWKRYESTFYPGRLTLIRAEVRPYQPGQIDDDPRQGWDAFVGGGVDLCSMHAKHELMLKPEHAPALAAILADRVRALEPRAVARARQL